MSARGWCTKEDLQRDLVEINGNVTELEDHYLTYDGRPPPLVLHNDDSELELMFGDNATREVFGSETIEPDLHGITQMLRQVQEYEDNADDDPPPAPGGHGDVIVISKLNPNCKEFIPQPIKSSQNGGTSPSKDEKIKESTVKISEEKNNTDVTSSVQTNIDDLREKNCVPKNDTDVTVSVDKKIAELREKISVSKNETLTHKRARNVALASILRGCEPTVPQEETPVKLMPPSFYETTKVEQVVDNVASDVTSANYSSSVVCTSNDEAVKEAESDPKQCLDVAEGSNKVSSDARSGTVTPLDDSSKESIEKVTKWFNYDPQASRKQNVEIKSMSYLKTITYKRKEVPSPNAGIEDKMARIPEDKVFVPSSYADELLAKFTKNEESQKSPRNLWDNLEEELKKRDEVIRNRSSQSGDSSGRNSRTS